MASGDRIRQSQGRVQALKGLRSRYLKAVENAVDAESIRSYTDEIRRLDDEIAHLMKGITQARRALASATPGTVDEEPETFDRNALPPDPDDDERPTEHWDPNRIMPDGRSMAEALAELRAGPLGGQPPSATPGTLEDGSPTDEFQRTRVRRTGGFPATPTPPRRARGWRERSNFNFNLNEIMVFTLIVLSTTGVAIYFIMN